VSEAQGEGKAPFSREGDNIQSSSSANALQCDRVKPCRACCTRGAPSECEYGTSKKDRQYIDQSDLIQHLRERCRALEIQLSTATDEKSGTPLPKTTSEADENALQSLKALTTELEEQTARRNVRRGGHVLNECLMKTSGFATETTRYPGCVAIAGEATSGVVCRRANQRVQSGPVGTTWQRVRPEVCIGDADILSFAVGGFQCGLVDLYRPARLTAEDAHGGKQPVQSNYRTLDKSGQSPGAMQIDGSVGGRGPFYHHRGG
jgi:hypothetical protein